MKRGIINKYVLLAVLVIAVFALPSCRTRITNNSEVSNIQYDEDGYLTDTYQMRRDELGLSTAERPLLPDFGSGETEENDDFSEGEEINYNPEDYQEDFTEPETTTNTNTNTNTNTGTTPRSTTRRPTNTTPSRRSTTTNDTYTVTFNANKGTVNGKSTYQIKVKKNSKISSKISKFPTAKNGSQSTTKWYTSQNGGSEAKLSDKISGPITLWAHWDSSSGGGDDEKETIIVTLDYDDGKTDSTTIKVTEGGKYEELNDPPSRGIGYTFKGWYSGDKRVKNGDSVDKSITSLKAKWDYSPKDFWDNEFKEAANSIKAEDKRKCAIEGQTKGKKNLIEECKGDVTENNAEAMYVIMFIDGLDDSKATAAANDIKNAKAEDGSSPKYPNLEKVVLIDTDAVESEGNQKTLYKMMILEELYGSGVWIDGNDVSKAKGEKELNVDGVKPITK